MSLNFTKDEDKQLNMRIDSKTAWDGKDDLTGSVQWKDVGDLIPSNHAAMEASSFSVTQMNPQLIKGSSNSLSDKTTWIHKDYSENVVSETKLPERIVCYDHDSSRSVKDISLIYRLHSSKKGLLGNNDATEKVFLVSESSATNTHTHLSFTINEDIASALQDLESASINGNKPSWNLYQARENSNTTEQIKIDISHQQNCLDQLLPLGDSIGMPNELNPTNFDISNDLRQSNDQKVIEEVVEGEIISRDDAPLDIAESEGSSKTQDNAATSTSDITKEEEHSETSVASSDVTSSGTEENPVSNEITTDVDFTFYSAKMIGRKESKENIDSKHLVQIDNSSAAVDTLSNGATASAQNSLYLKHHSDLTLQSRPYYLSGPKTSSAHIEYPGSISLSSDSSTTSTRSFAFPVVQTEWFASPVKMGKADRRRPRKCWPKTLICCFKF